MEKGNTKQEILEVALDLFSTQGYEATSVAQIAGAVGIRKASLYSHFASKQGILDALVREVLEQYGRHSIFAQADWEDPAFTRDKQDVTPDVAVQMILGQVRYILHDPQIRKSRKMLTVEQFQNRQVRDCRKGLENQVHQSGCESGNQQHQNRQYYIGSVFFFHTAI